MLTWLGYISEWVGDTRGDSCCWSTLFKFVFEVEDLVDIKSWLNEYLEAGNSTWIVPSVCCIIFEGVVKGLIGFGRIKSFNSYWPPWVISFHFSFLGTKTWVLLGLSCGDNVSSLTYWHMALGFNWVVMTL